MSGMPVAEQPPVRRWLLPHERWFHWVESGGRRGRVNQRALSRQLRKYGPDRAVLIDAAMGNWVAASPFLIAAATITTTGHGTAILPWMWGADFLFFAIGFVRFVQASSAGERFRATGPRPGRPLG
jgi:hypothetical protein